MKKSNFLMMFVAGMMLFSITGYAMNRDATPVHRPLLEEYTGTWCGWCVRGLVGMELCNETFGDNFIGVAYHYGDNMETINPNYYPNDISGFPSAFLERAYDVDPYYGFGNTSAGILEAISDCAAQAVNADLEVKAQWTSEAKTEISVDVNSYFTINSSNGRYVLEIMLVADDLYGTGSNWNQANYYSGYTACLSDPYLAPYVRKGSTLTGIHYNDVLLATSQKIEGSLPRSIVAYEDYTFNYSFTLSALPVPSLVQNKDNLRVVAIIVDIETGNAINANKGYISDYVEMPLTFEVDGICYCATTMSIASVIANEDEDVLYSGDVVIPDYVTYQGVTFAVTGIEENAFDGCYELTSVVIPNTVETIGWQAFQGCTSLTSVTIGSGVTAIGAKAFNYCNALETVKCLGTVPPVMASSNCFSTAAYNRATLRVPRNSEAAYAAADYWYRFAHLEGWGSAGMGDIDGDGLVNIKDVTALIDALLSGNTEDIYYEAADMNYNGHLDIADVTTLIDYLLNN